MKLLNKRNLAVRFAASKFAASKEQSRYATRGILATENETVATDGHVLARVSLPRDANAGNFPTIDGFKPNGFSRGVIPTEAAKEIENAIPASKIPALNFAAITTEHVDGKDMLRVAATDLETPKVFTVRQPDGAFPQWDGAIWPTDAPTMDVCFDARLLAAVSTAAAKFSDNRLCAIRLRFYHASSAMRFDVVNDNQEMNGLLMPCRAAVNPTFKELAKPKPVAASEPEPEEEETEPAAQAVGSGEEDERDCQEDWANGVNDAVAQATADGMVDREETILSDVVDAAPPIPAAPATVTAPTPEPTPETTREQVIAQCKRELAINFEIPAKEIMAAYGAKLGLTVHQMLDVL